MSLSVAKMLFDQKWKALEGEKQAKIAHFVC